MSPERTHASPVRSMTGFATAGGRTAHGSVFAITVKSVNHRHLDLQLRLPPGFDAFELPLRTAVKAVVHRGHVELALSFSKAAQSPVVSLDEAMLAACAEAFERAAALLEVKERPEVSAILRLPGVLTQTVPAADPEDVAAEVLACAAEALERWNIARSQEGASLADTLHDAMERMLAMTVEARALREGVGAAQWLRLKQRLQELGLEAGEERLLVEAALLVDRGEVEEELVRLETHIRRFLGILETGGETGRQLDFLLQELNREANTLLAKSGASAGEAGLRLIEIGLAMKLELERAREQVQNIE